MPRVPFAAGEKTSLRAALTRHREAVLWKLEGLDDEPGRRQVLPSGTSLLGLVKHLGAVEYGWFCEPFGRATEPLPFDDDDPDADLRVEPHETTADVLVHMLEETARHAGHADVVRELIDGTTGDHREEQEQG